MGDGSSTLTARETARLIRRKELSPVEIVSRALDEAEATQATLNAFTVLRREEALNEARAAEAGVMRGDALGALHGLPFSVKDLISVEGLPYTFGSRAMADNMGNVDAPAVERARAAGAILIGKTTTSEFGCKPVGDSPLTGVTRNPIDLKLTPGGSSAGCAASVAAGITPFALGTDGGGSIRIPAAFTGTFGFRRISAACQSGRPRRRRRLRTSAHSPAMSATPRCSCRPLQAATRATPRPSRGLSPTSLRPARRRFKACASPGVRRSAMRSPSPKW
jgi:aspartyl-tRNA(Asn)/glutamyl-tRNA(Gln) amidotransferase subunit A